MSVRVVGGVRSYSLRTTEISELLPGGNRHPLQKAKVQFRKVTDQEEEAFLWEEECIGNYLGKGKIWRRK